MSQSGWSGGQHAELCDQALLEAVHQAQQKSTNQEFIRFRDLVDQSKSGFLLVSGLFSKKIAGLSPLVIPGDALLLQQKILEELHILPLGSHVGCRRLLELVRTRFWWPRLTKSVQEFFQQCIPCQQAKVGTQKPLGLLQPLEPPARPFEQVAMDLITHLPLSNGYDAVFTVVDRFLQHVTFLPCQTSSSALDLAQIFYNNIVCKFGMLVKIISDRDTRFLPKFWQSLMNIL